jgi:hypothetical protein
MILYRLVRANPPTALDFRSPADAGRPIPSPDKERTFRSVSTYITEHAALEINRRFHGRLGSFIARLDVPDTVARTQEGDHVDLHDTTPEQLLTYVVGVSPVPGGTIAP